MKKSFLLVVIFLSISLFALAEMTIYVYKKDGTKVPYVASAVDSIGFVDVTTPEAVDLGLPSGTKWANMNVGANKPEDYGDYYAWGEIQPKTAFSWTNYKWCNGTSDYLTKYNIRNSYGVVDNKTILELSDDAANANWGGDWRLPTDVEARELFNSEYCSWSMVTQNGVIGYKVVSKINGNSIFMPAAGGYNEYNSTVVGVGSYGHYMTCMLNSAVSPCSYSFSIPVSSDVITSGSRVNGNSIRPVLPKETYYTVSFDANGGEGSMSTMKIEHGTNVVLPTNTFTKDYATFVRWSTTADGTGGWYDDQAILNPNTNITLYAQWENITSGVADGHEWVDLGLPSGTKWANMNVGANKPEDYGDYYAWGETWPKSRYNWATYKWCDNEDGTSFTKYNKSQNFGIVDNKTILELSDDAANANWAGNWRLPTDVEASELFNAEYCSWSMVIQNGVTGYKVISKINGNSIFLPFAGFYDHNYDINSAIQYEGSAGHYMTCMLGASVPVFTEVFTVSTDGEFVEGGVSTRSTGNSVRPVLPKETYYTVSFDANGGEGSMPAMKIEHGTNVVLPTNTFTKDYATFVRWSTTADGTGGWYDDQAILNPNTDITLYAQWENATTGVENGYEWVDLGLPSGTKWATMNVGANSPEEYGDYFAWGETELKSIYNWETYKWCDGNHNSLTKYCANSDYGVVDNKNVLEFEDDVASVAFGGEWRIPTIAECEQLLDENNCLWTWTTQNNVKGFHVTSKINGNTIFLPAAGFCSSEVNGIGNFGAYCVNSIAYAGQVQISSNCYYLRFHSNAKGLDNQGRCVGICIRPVLSAK